MKTRERIYIFMVIFSLLTVLLCCPVGAQESETVPEINVALDEDAAPVETGEDLTDAVLYAAGADTALTAAPAEEETFAGNAIGQWLDKTFYKLDYAVFTAFSKIQNDVLTSIVNIVTYFGDSAVVIPLLLVGLVLCLFKKTRRYGIVLAGAIILGTLMTNVVLKNVCGRVRPYVTLADDPNFYLWYTRAGANVESDNSFPSGHTTAAFEVATALFLTVKNKKIKWIFPVYAVIILCTRLYLMVHYCSDVMAGVLVGITAGVLSYCITKAIMNFLDKNPKLGNIDLAQKLGKKKA